MIDSQIANAYNIGNIFAGFIAGYITNKSYSEALKLSVASSAATAFSKELAKADEIYKIYKEL